MKYIEFHKKMSAQDIRFYRKFANTYLLMTIISLVVIAAIGYAIYKDNSSIFSHILLGTMIANAIYNYGQWKITLSEFKEAKERNGRLEEADVKDWEKSSETMVLNMRVSNLEKRASELVDENKILKSKLQAAEMSSCKHQATSIHQPDATSTQ